MTSIISNLSAVVNGLSLANKLKEKRTNIKYKVNFFMRPF
jgi:hypothetical protein